MSPKNTVKWKTLEHNGLLLAPKYRPLPKNVMIKYNGVPTPLDSTNTNNQFNVSAEEAMTFFAMKIEQDERLQKKNSKRKSVLEDKKFIENFWNDWKIILGKSSIIKDFKKVDFTPVKKYISERAELEKEEKKRLSKEEKAEIKEQKEEIKRKYGSAKIDGKKILIGGLVIQPPNVFIGHGNAPLRGKIKGRIEKKDVVLNMSKEFFPKFEGWKDLVSDHNATYLAYYFHPLTRERVYVWLKRDESHWVTDDDQNKFDKARELNKNIDSIRKKYMKDMKSDNLEKRQLSVCCYLLDILAIRPGTEKDENKEAGTQGLTTLQCENFKFKGDNEISLDFTGKSSIQFKKKVKIDPQAYLNLKAFCSGEKRTKSKVFSKLNATTLNAYLKTLMPELTAKNFRTWKASSILQEQLDKNIPDVGIDTHKKKLIYDRVNMEVAKALNHKNLGNNSDEKIQKLEKKILEYKMKKRDAKTDKQKQTAEKNIEMTKAKLEEASDNISLSTSKVNYLDPRISVAWAKKCDMPIEKLYNKTQLKKFTWAMTVQTKWNF